ncbi:hypothetical protein H2201_004358 [Coniosporium apollinis]|uniref:15-hydroxyprostaglandin dehydrogenase n=1 Tax=Coniosporium apollinis TaxID=61459 RepID=A0ABQ9NSY6_9PEZI|nr:hypothetical protein H2201_004358 [Coniosporium apollinis]
MGEALSRDLVSRGWQVAMADIQANEELSKELGENAAFFRCDVADYDSQAQTFQAVWDKYGRLDALCANAGIVDRSSIYILNHRDPDKLPPKPDLLCTDVDYKGVVYGTVLAVHFMRKNKTPGGKIVTTASCAALYPHETYPEYDGAKAAVLNFVRATSRVLKIKDNININAVLPGIVHTKIIPQEMIDAVSPECLTPIDQIVKAYNTFLDDDEGSCVGEAIECSVDKHCWVPRPEYLNGKFTKRAVTVWDPLFKMYHGELSELPDAIP